MKKFLCAFLAVFVLCAACHAEEIINAGVLTYLGTTEDEFQEGLDDLRKAVAPLLPQDESDFSDFDMLENFVIEIVKTRRVIHFYDSLLSMQMALRSGKIDEISLPESVGMYLVNNNPSYEILFSLNMMPSTISFGFKKGNTALQKEFNAAITAMKKDGTLEKLASEYISDISSDPERVEFTTFKGAKTIKAAVTGDLPPIDFINADGQPAGYNTAILSEIGRRLKKNISIFNVDAGGRSAALSSGRADVIFWYRNTEGLKTKAPKNLRGVMKDTAEGVILSEPYYEWDTDLIIGRTK